MNPLRSTRRTRRALSALVLAFAQLGAGTALPSADAVLDAERVGLPVHVESPHSESCPGSHDHLFCQVVRSLAAATAAPSGGGIQGHVAHQAGGDLLGDRLDPPSRPPVGGPTSPRPPPLG